METGPHKSLEWWGLHVRTLARRGLPERLQGVLIEGQDEDLLHELEAMSDRQLRQLPKSDDDETPPPSAEGGGIEPNTYQRLVDRTLAFRVPDGTRSCEP
jgi:hypothetical protein